jgi:hypothetical protein
MWAINTSTYGYIKSKMSRPRRVASRTLTTRRGLSLRTIELVHEVLLHEPGFALLEPEKPFVFLRVATRHLAGCRLQFEDDPDGRVAADHHHQNLVGEGLVERIRQMRFRIAPLVSSSFQQVSFHGQLAHVHPHASPIPESCRTVRHFALGKFSFNACVRALSIYGMLYI